MFQRFKSKTKAPSLRIQSQSADSKGIKQSAETISMASMPLVPQTNSSAVIHDTGPRLFTLEDLTVPESSALLAKKSLNFENATAPPEQVIVHDTAVQTATTSQTIQGADATAGGATGTSLQTHQVARHPNIIKQCEKQQLHRIFLPKALATGKQFQLRTLPVHQKEYPII